MEVKAVSEFDLLVGWKSSVDETIKEIKIDEYTGKHERRVVKKEYLNNPARGVTELITAITLKFGPYSEMRRQQAGKLKVCDRNLIMLHLRLLDDETFKYIHECPTCQHKSNKTVNLMSMPVNDCEEPERDVELLSPYKQEDAEFKFARITMPNGDCQVSFFDALNNQDPVAIKMAMIKHCLLGVKSNKKDSLTRVNPLQFFDNVKSATVTRLIEEINKLSEGVGPQLRVTDTCDNCGHAEEREVPIALFF